MERVCESIWGYVAFDADGSTIYGAYFAPQGETPGLAEIEISLAFSSEFIGKTVFKQGVFMPVAVVKAGQKPLGGEDYVDGISGGTITSKGCRSHALRLPDAIRRIFEKPQSEEIQLSHGRENRQQKRVL